MLEHWLLGKYEKSMDLVEDKEPYGYDYRLADLCGIYVGEVYRRQLGGTWYMILDQPKNVYYKLPSLRYETRTARIHLPADLGHSLHPEKARGLYALGARELYRGEETTRERQTRTVSSQPNAMMRERSRITLPGAPRYGRRPEGGGEVRTG